MLKKFSWGHGIIIALGTFILFILYMIFYFGNQMKNAEMVSENYYEDELYYQNVIDAKNLGTSLVMKPKYIQNAAGIALQFPKEIVPDDKMVNYLLFRTEDANLDIKKSIRLNEVNSFNIFAKNLVPGSYTLKVTWKLNNQLHQLDYAILWK